MGLIAQILCLWLTRYASPFSSPDRVLAIDFNMWAQFSALLITLAYVLIVIGSLMMLITFWHQVSMSTRE